MIAVFDACTLINLLLTVSDTSYIKYMEKVFDKISIVEKVYQEIKNNRNDNDVEDEFYEEYERTIFTYLNNFVNYEIDSDAISYTKESLNYKKDNGELMSISHALHLSRYGDKIQRLDYLLDVHFITDDEPATIEFSNFYESNFIGKILTSIDFLVICCLKGLITRREVVNYCNSLKRFYNKPIALLGKDLKFLLEKEQSLTSKERIIANKIINLINDLDENTNDNLSRILETADARSLLSNYKFLNQRFDKVLNSNFRDKIPSINLKQSKLEQIWLLDFSD